MAMLLRSLLISSCALPVSGVSHLGRGLLLAHGDQDDTAGILGKPPAKECDAEEALSVWQAHSDAAGDVIETWQQQVPTGRVLVANSNFDLCAAGGEEAADAAVAKTLTIVHTSGDDFCLPAPDMKEEPQEWRDSEDVTLEISTFGVLGAMAEANPERSYVLATPKATACTAKKPCPLMVSLHGVGEHGAPGDEESLKQLGKTGLLRMATQDQSCAEKLRSAILVPQILENESFVKDGPRLLDEFVLPLVRQVQATTHIDPERIGIVGFSEGALGALHAAIRYETTFSLVVAASSSIPTWGNMTEAIATAPQLMETPAQGFTGHPMVAVTLGEKDSTGDQSANMLAILDLLKSNDVFDRMRFDARILAGATHNHWEKVFNNWQSFLDAAWLGNFPTYATE